VVYRETITTCDDLIDRPLDPGEHPMDGNTFPCAIPLHDDLPEGMYG